MGTMTMTSLGLWILDVDESQEQQKLSRGWNSTTDFKYLKSLPKIGFKLVAAPAVPKSTPLHHK